MDDEELNAIMQRVNKAQKEYTATLKELLAYADKRATNSEKCGDTNNE